MSRIPENIGSCFRYFKDDKTGDKRVFHLYCYYWESPHSVLEHKRHRSWEITGTEYAAQKNRAKCQEALEKERRQENEKLFNEDIIQWLEQQGKRLVPMQRGDETILVLMADERSEGGSAD